VKPPPSQVALHPRDTEAETAAVATGEAHRPPTNPRAIGTAIMPRVFTVYNCGTNFNRERTDEVIANLAARTEGAENREAPTTYQSLVDVGIL
jgi:hypothetical protein